MSHAGPYAVVEKIGKRGTANFLLSKYQSSLLAILFSFRINLLKSVPVPVIHFFARRVRPAR
jgi:hypothetical protein